MVLSRTFRTLGFAAASIALAWTPTEAAGPVITAGSIIGFVSNAVGTVQMGATVRLYNRFDRLVHQAITNERGAFGFESLPPDIYSVRVSLSSFMPAVRDKVMVTAGARSFLTINMASAISSIELIYNGSGQAAVMSDDWKWVLRSSMATRPVLRLVAEQRPAYSIFSGTRGIVKLSAGDSSMASSAGSQPDLGTAFAVATSLYGINHLQFSGNVGFAARAGAATTGFSTRYSRNLGDTMNPEVQITMRQVALPAHFSGAASRDSQPQLRTLTASLMDHAQIGENVQLEYGSTMESVSFLDRLNYFSPYARITINTGDSSTLRVAFSSGQPPAELLQNSKESNLQKDISTLNMFPRISVRDGRARVQRSENMELGYHATLGSRSLSVATYREQVVNGAVLASGGSATGDMLPDLFSNSQVFNIGSHSSIGYMAALTQNIGDRFTATFAYGSAGVLRADGAELQSNSPDELRSMIHSSHRRWAATRIAGTIPVTATRFVGSYQWTDYSTLAASHRYITQSFSPETGLNLQIRQPLPTFGMFPGRLEATAEIRNMLAQGYLPITGADGRQLLLVQSPRALRGGFSFIF
jgi:hypothetical protein